jgi:hypothetical protein
MATVSPKSNIKYGWNKAFTLLRKGIWRRQAGA